MTAYISFILSLLIVIPAIIGWVRFQKISSAFLPFLLLTWIGAFNEVLNYTLVIVFKQYNVINTNVYQLIESLLVLWQFKRWRLFSDDRNFIFLVISFIVAFLLENILISKFYQGFNSYFHIFYAFILVLLSINMLNHILMTERGLVIRNSTFIICCVFIVMFTYTVLVETFWAYGVEHAYKTKLQNIFVFVNLLCNVIYTFVMLWMPKRQAFSLQY